MSNLDSFWIYNDGKKIRLSTVIYSTSKEEFKALVLESKLNLLKGKKYVPEYLFQVKEIDKLDDEEIARRITFADKLKEYGVEITVFDDFKELSEIQWTKKLESKLNLLKGKEYAPEYLFRVKEIDKLDDEEIARRITFADKLKEYGVEITGFDNFKELSEIQWTKKLESKLNLLKGKEYAPKYLFRVKEIYKLDDEEIARRITFADKLKEYGVEIIVFDDFEELSEIQWTKKLESKLNLLKGTKAAPEYLFQVKEIDKLDDEHISKLQKSYKY